MLSIAVYDILSFTYLPYHLNFKNSHICNITYINIVILHIVTHYIHLHTCTLHYYWSIHYFSSRIKF